MQKTVLTKAVAVALATLGAGAAFAQSSLTLYGNIDAAVDSVHKNAGLTPFGTAAAKSTVTRVSPSISSQNSLGVKGTEDLGGGWKGNFVLEGQFNTDTGAQGGQDSRMWGRQAYVGVTTPGGEVRIGRQYAPIFYNFAFTTVEAIGAADLMASGLVVNNLQVRQDNQMSYWLKTGGLTGAISFSPNAGSPVNVSQVRAPSTNGNTTGQIIGGASAGDENNTGRGRAYGLFLNYATGPEFSINGGVHYNKFGETRIGYYTTAALGPIPAGTFLPFFNAEKYIGYALGAKYVVGGNSTVLAAIYHDGKFTNDSGRTEGPRVQTLALGAKHPIENFAVGVEAVYSRFSNFTKGKDLAVMLAGDYNLSKRTRIYTRIGFLRDTAGNAATTDVAGVTLRGGPAPILSAIGSAEVPFFAGGSANVDATTRVAAIGIRHSF